MNFTRDVVDAAPPSRQALLCLSAEGNRSVLTFGETAAGAARLAGTLAARRVGRGDVVMTVMGNRPEWVLALLACFRIGAVALPCSAQLRPADLRARMDCSEPRLVLADVGSADTVRAAGFTGPVLTVPEQRLFDSPPAPAATA